MEKKPLVSIMIPNYNHSRYLEECIKSAVNQTYDNVEIVLVDNSSEDNSIQLAAKYVGNKIRICRNGYNILNRSYCILDKLTTGKYKMMLCADDFIEPDFLEKAVAIMEKYPNVGYVHGERDFVMESGEFIELEPFYNCSFLASGRDTMPVYMVTTVAHPSQGIFRAEVFHKCGGYDLEVDHMNADRMLWYYLSYESDYAYIRKKASNIRIGNQTETFITQANFQHPILCHLTIKEMIRFAKRHGLEMVYRREKEAFERLAKDFLNYAAGMLAVEDKVCAGRYLDYVRILSDDIVEQEIYQQLFSMQQGMKAINLEYLKKITSSALKKPRNYEPPHNYQKIDLEVL
ncbi:chondroitin synthase [Lachnospiraceae bacterium]|nr:chondroitin synthase [Lachnospiraceae bacterium]